MPDTKISALTEKVTSNAADYLVIVDSITAENRKVKRENILRADGEDLVLIATSGGDIILNNNANGGAVVISDNLKTDLITEKTGAAGVTIAGTGGLKTSLISSAGTLDITSVTHFNIASSNDIIITAMTGGVELNISQLTINSLVGGSGIIDVNATPNLTFEKGIFISASA